VHRVTKDIRFCYGHRLMNYAGECRHLHGHNGLIQITFATKELDDLGMVMDFGEIKRIVKTWVDEHMDHKMLISKDDPVLPYLQEAGEPYFLFETNPTAENIARVIFEFARGQGYPVERVRLWETDTAWAEYSE
jgi:6-pyruvoyltetrahydropterin/6-carboxytetrahydropterin synthase